MKHKRRTLSDYMETWQHLQDCNDDHIYERHNTRNNSTHKECICCMEPMYNPTPNQKSAAIPLKPTVLAKELTSRQKLYNILNLTFTSTEESLHRKPGYHGRTGHDQWAFDVVTKITEQVFHLLYHDVQQEQDAMVYWATHIASVANDHTSLYNQLIQNMSSVCLSTQKDYSILFQSLLSSSLEYGQYTSTLGSWRSQVKHRKTLSPLRRLYTGKSKYENLKSLFVHVVAGNEMPGTSMNFRVPAHKVLNAIQFVHELLPMKPGHYREVRMGTHIFPRMPVFLRGSYSFKSLFQTFRLAFPSKEEHCGEPTFHDIVLLLTMKGKGTTGLSNYYTRLRDVTVVFVLLLFRIQEMHVMNENYDIPTELGTLEDEWKSLYTMLQYDFSHSHLELCSEDPMHCCTYAAGGICSHSHTNSKCSQCYRCMTFFSRKVLPILQCIEKNSSGIMRTEVATMCSSLFEMERIVRWYMAHKVRAKVQAAAIEKLKQSLIGNNKKGP
jgi:hypothetical protein